MSLKICLSTLLISTCALVAIPETASAEDLQSALVSVYNKNPRLLAERARLREVDENYIQARAQGRFTISGSGSYSKAWIETPAQDSFFGPPAEGTNTEYGAPKQGAVQVVQPLYQGGRVKALKRQAKLGILSAREGLRAQENNIFTAAANAYVDVLRDEEAARIRRNNVRVLSRQLQAATDRFDVGEGTRTDIAQSESRLALSEAGLAQADAQLAASRASYFRIVGRLPRDLSQPPEFIIPPTLQDAITAARDNNPQLMAAYYNEASSRAAIDVAKAAGRPVVSLNGSLSRSRDQLLGFNESDNAALTANITIPIYSGGQNQSRVRQAKHAKTRLAFETRDTELAVDQTITQIWAQLEAARIVLDTSERQQRAAEVAFEGVTLEQTVGTRTQLDVLDAEQEVLNARLSVVNAQRELNSATYSLLSTIGVFDAEGIRLDVDRYQPEQNLDAISYDGLAEAADAYVPEFVQKIGRQVPNIVNDAVGVPVTLIGKSDLGESLDNLGDRLGGIGTDAKEALDYISNQDPEYDPRLRTDNPEIIIEPIKPASAPPYDPLLDGDADGVVDPEFKVKD
ncbi:TolC family outer membrane protein [Litorimonas sp. WD9-15]|uniref:TolC family outer membrane protein n=1 Tax=Litorimonas sp. WD9-15 TaxID=3418716 RepID=UPI003CFDFCE3